MGGLTTLVPGSRSLKAHVTKLAVGIGERNFVRPDALAEAARWLEGSLGGMGYRVLSHRYVFQGQEFRNLSVELAGTREPQAILVLGAHYDTVPGSPGANDNGSGVAALLEIARSLAGKPQAKTLRFVFFVNEEPPFFLGEGMGSLHYARECHARGERIEAMLSLETIGYYSDRPKSQDCPPVVRGFYPSTGNFLAIVGNPSSAALVKRVAASFARTSPLPVEMAALPESVPGVAWSDQWSFWRMGYPAVMLTDTAPYRYPHYHLGSDLPEQLSYEKLREVVTGVLGTIQDLAKS